MGEPDVEHGAALLLAHDAKAFRDAGFNVFRALDDAGEGAARGRSDAGIIRRRIEAQVQVPGAAGEAVRMNGKRGELGRLPAAIVEDDLQKRRPVAARYPTRPVAWRAPPCARS